MLLQFSCKNCNLSKKKICLLKRWKKFPESINLDHNTPAPADEIPLDLSKKTNESFKMEKKKRKDVGKKSFKCDICFKNFTKRKVWKVHTSTVHEKKKPFECEFCKAGFIQKSSMKSHVVSVHEEKRPFKCEKCEYTAPKRRRLQQHIDVVHEGKEPFKHHKCERCDHGLRTPNEDINQRYLKNWADVADKICFGRTVKAISSPGVRSPL